MLLSVRVADPPIKGLRAKWGKKLTRNGKKPDIEPPVLYKKIVFCMFCILLFWGISSYMIIGDYLTIPVKRSLPEWNILDDVIEKYHNIGVKKDFWVISVGDSKISNIENYIIFVLMGFGFLRVIDLLFYMKKYNNF